MKLKTTCLLVICGGFLFVIPGYGARGAVFQGMEYEIVSNDQAMYDAAASGHPATPLWRYNVSLLALNDEKEPAAIKAPSKGWNWHKTLGLGTIITALATVASGFTGPEGPHCGMAALSAGLAAATCVNGFWTYGNIFTAGDTRLSIHAVSGILSTVGFGAATALADDSPHGQIGAASGALFLVTVGVVYF